MNFFALNVSMLETNNIRMTRVEKVILREISFQHELMSTGKL